MTTGRSTSAGWPACAARAAGGGLLALLAGGLLGGCAINRLAVNRMGDALAGSSPTFASDDDPDLIRLAVPFSLKLMESLLAENPRHEGLLLAAARGFTQYSYAFVSEDADETEAQDLAQALALRDQARRLYLRAHRYGLRGLEIRHAGFTAQLRRAPNAAVQAAGPADVPLLYWTATAWGAAIALAKDEPERVAEIPQLEALIYRALALDERWDHGAIHTFLITYEMARPGAAGGAAARARRHFERAMELTGGQQAGPLVAYAEAVCVQQQDVRQFDALLRRALAINADAVPAYRLANLILQRRARWLLSRRDDLFLLPVKPATP